MTTINLNDYLLQDAIDNTIRYCGLPSESLSTEVELVIRQYIDAVANAQNNASLKQLRLILRANYPRNNTFFGSQIAYLNSQTA